MNNFSRPHQNSRPSKKGLPDVFEIANYLGKFKCTVIIKNTLNVATK
jgi:hypothetical protein